MVYEDKPCNDKCIPSPLGNTLDLTDPMETKFVGVYNSMAEMEQEKPAHNAEPGSYGYVVVGSDTFLVTLDNAKWLRNTGTGTIAMTAKVVKDLYESNPNTNGVDDKDKQKLDSCFCGGVPVLPLGDGEYKLKISGGNSTWVRI